MKIGGTLMEWKRLWRVGIPTRPYPTLGTGYEEDPSPKFLEVAAEELIQEEWKMRSTAKLPQPTELELSTSRLG
jgi:hypothetical protein